MSTTHQCARPATAQAEQWRCPDCSLLWEPLPAAPVSPVSKGPWRLLAGRLAAGARIAQMAAGFVLLWAIGARTAAVALTLGALAIWGCVWAWTKFRNRQARS
ncbi:hypothetical protein GCM10023334_081500 [Nonomuraea thailandensis]